MTTATSSTALTVYKPKELWTGFIIAVWDEPFSLGTPNVELWRNGMSVADIVAAMKDLPPDFERVGVVELGDVIIPRDKWTRVYPKPHSPENNCVLRFMMPVHGGDDNGKGILAIVATLGLALITGGIAAGWLATSSGWFTAGSLSARLLSFGVSLLGSMVIGALTAPPVQKNETGTTRTASSVSGNVLEINAPIPAVIGTRWIFPPFAMQPYIEYVSQDEVLHAIYVLAGAHKINELRLGDSAVTLTNGTAGVGTDLSIEIKQGLPTDKNLLLTNKQAVTTEYNLMMSTHQVKSDDMNKLENDTTASLPVWHALSIRRLPNEVRIQMALQGLVTDDDRTAELIVPLIFRMRSPDYSNGLWITFPEVYYKRNTQSERLIEIVLKFSDAPTTPKIPSTVGFYAAAKTIITVPYYYGAHSHFSAGSGNDILDSSTYATSNVRNVELDNDTLTFYLPASFWNYEYTAFEMKRGATLKASAFNLTAYTYSGTVWNLYDQIDGTIPFTRKGLMDGMYIKRSTNIWYDTPLLQNDLTVISLTARNRAVDKLQVKASGYVYDWSGFEMPAGVSAQNLIQPSSGGSNTGTQPYILEYVTKLPAVGAGLNGYIWYMSGGGYGAAIYILNDELVTYVGLDSTAITQTSTETVIIKLPISELPTPAQAHRYTWAFTTNPVRVQIFCDGQLIAEDTATTTTNTPICGTSGQFLNLSSSTIPGYSGTMTRVMAVVQSIIYRYDNGMVDTSKAGWTNLTTTNCPAPNFRHVLTGVLGARNVPETAIDDEMLLAWRWHCLVNDYTVDMIAENIDVWELLTIIASCGYARPVRSEKYSVFIDYDRSAEQPVQVFTPVQSSDFTWSKGFAQMPAGLRLTYADTRNMNKDQQVIVRDPIQSGRGDRLETARYEGFVDEQKTIRRGLFDLAQANHRNVFYSLKVPANWIRCKRGSLVAVAYDSLDKHMFNTVITSVTKSGSNIVGITVESPVMIYDTDLIHDIPDIYTVSDIYEQGLQMGVTIQMTDGQLTSAALSNVGGLTSYLTFTTPIPVSSWSGSSWDGGSVDLIAPDCVVIVGIMSRMYQRLIVSEITPSEQLQAAITMVDEASFIFSQLEV